MSVSRKQFLHYQGVAKQSLDKFKKLAEKVRVTTTYIGFIEQGRHAPSLELLNKIAKALGVKVRDIFPF